MFDYVRISPCLSPARQGSLPRVESGSPDPRAIPFRITSRTTRSPVYVQRGTFAVLRTLPGPTATTSPFIGFSFAVSGIIIPPLIASSSSDRFTDPIVQVLRALQPTLLIYVFCFFGAGLLTAKYRRLFVSFIRCVLLVSSVLLRGDQNCSCPDQYRTMENPKGIRNRSG